MILDTEFNLIVDDVELALVEKLEIGFYLFNFGNKFYYLPLDKITEVQLTPFRYIGDKCKETIENIQFVPLAIHSGYELLNGSNIYKNWIKKAKFLGFDTIGVCERNSLAGVMDFQANCKKANIKSIIGEEISIQKGENVYIGKVYVCNEKGWINLLQISNEINVFNINRKVIAEDRLLQLSEGLIFVFNYDTILSDSLIRSFKSSYFENIYFQIDSVIWEDEERDKKFLLNLKNYVDNYIDVLPPVLINDCYYLENDDYEIKGILNRIGNLSHQGISKNQYFKKYR